MALPKTLQAAATKAAVELADRAAAMVRGPRGDALPTRMKGGEVLARLLAADEVTRVFGIVDGTYLGFFAAFADQGIELVAPRHETCAVHMAGAYARLTGRLGVCMASNGPGVANALSGVAVEEAEGNRVLLVTSCRRVGTVYPDRGGTYQSFPQSQVIGAMAKEALVVPSIERLAELTRRALRTSWSGRPGVVHLDVPESVMNTEVDVDPAWFRAPSASRATAPLAASAAQVAAAAALLRGASRPMIHAGSGVLHAGASTALAAVAELLGAPICTSWAARAAVDERNPAVVSMLYTAATRRARTESDVVLVLGSRLGESDFWGKGPYWARPDAQQVIQVDCDAATLGNNRPLAIGAQADVGVFLEALLAVLRAEGGGVTAERTAWRASLRADCAARRAALDEALRDDRMPMHSARVAGACQRVFGDDAILVLDGGNTSIWGHFYWEVRRIGGLLTTPKMGMLGAGVPQAIAARVAHPEAPVVAIVGDGAMAFHQQEVETAVRHGLPVVWVVLCDRQWGMVKMTQQFALKPIQTLIRKRLEADETIHADLHEIAFDELARAMGAHGERVADPAGLEPALRRCLASGRPAVVHVDVDQAVHLWAPELKTFKEMHAEPTG